MPDLVRQLARGGGPSGAKDVVLLRGPDVNSPEAPLGRSSSGAEITALDTLRPQVENRSTQLWTYAAVQRDSGERVPVIVVGAPVVRSRASARTSCTSSSRSTRSRTRWAWSAARCSSARSAWSCCVGGIAWLVTRQVVTPVRMAARIAERLSAGRLEERMRVRGEDDLARLAASFNRMATSLQRQIRQLEDLSRVQRRFVSDVSHELRTPLTTVRMAADVLHEARDGFDPAVERSAEILQDAARPLRVAARRPARDQPLRRRRGAARGRADRPRGGRPPGGRGAGAARRAQRQPARAWSPRRSGASPRSTPGASSGCCATWSSTPSSTARAGRSSPRRRRRRGGRGRRARPRVGPAARRRDDGLQPVLAGRPGAGPHHRRHRPRPLDRPGGRPPARRLAAGVGRARRRLPVPADPARAARAWSSTGRRSRSSRSTRARRRRPVVRAGAPLPAGRLHGGRRCVGRLRPSCCCAQRSPAAPRSPRPAPVRQGRDLQVERQDDAVAVHRRQAGRRGEPQHRSCRASWLPAPTSATTTRWLASTSPTGPRQRWRPGAETVVHDGWRAAGRGGPGRRSRVARATEVARIDAEGSYRRTAGGARAHARASGSSSEDGEWRIAGLDDGLLLSQLDVSQTFRQVSLYFLSPSAQLAGARHGPGARAARPADEAWSPGCCAGRPPALRGSVLTGFPQGTSLEVQSVPVRDGLATVPLSDEALSADQDAREQMSAQIVWTPQAAGSEIERVRITGGGDDLVVAGVAQDQDRNSWLTYDPDGLATVPRSTRCAAAWSGGSSRARFQPVAGPAGTGDQPLRSPAVSPRHHRGRGRVARRRTLRTGRLAADGDLDGGPDRRRPEPAVVGPAGQPVGRRPRRPTGCCCCPAARARRSRWSRRRCPVGRPTAIAVSRDGARVALVAGRGAGRGSCSVRSPGSRGRIPMPPGRRGSPSRAVREILPELRAVRDVAWADATTLAVLGSPEGAPVAPFTTTPTATTSSRSSPRPISDRRGRRRYRRVRPAAWRARRTGSSCSSPRGAAGCALGPGTDPAYPG